MLIPWQTFYNIVGNAAATLTGLMFIVITLITQRQLRLPSPQSGVRFFNTSNVLHFGAALLVAAILSAPWPALWEAALLLGLTGLGGMVYVLFMLWEAVHRLRAGHLGYQLVLSDWLWYTFLPLVAYSAIVVAAIMLPISPVPVLFVIGAATVLLLFIGIHNAWDLVTYLIILNPQSQNTSQD